MGEMLTQNEDWFYNAKELKDFEVNLLEQKRARN